MSNDDKMMWSFEELSRDNGQQNEQWWWCKDSWFNCLKATHGEGKAIYMPGDLVVHCTTINIHHQERE